jgi:predicted amidohydrolase
VTAAAAPAPTLRLALAQTAPLLRDSGRNAQVIATLAAGAGAELLVTPELSFTGYDVGDAVHSLGVPVSIGTHLAAAGPLVDAPGQVVVGLVESGRGGPYNAAVVLAHGNVIFRHRKLYLPTYGMFDEARWFGRGLTVDVWEPTPGWRAGLLICEDFWHPGLSYVLASRGVDLLLVQAAAPGRGVWAGGEYGTFASTDVWERMARATAQVYGIYVALVNRVGIEGGVTFAGGSVVVGPDGEVIARAGDTEPELIAVGLSLDALQAARRPYSHARDDDVRLVMRELARIP